MIGILAEYDALPGVSQEAVAEKKADRGQERRTRLRSSLVRRGFGSAGIALEGLDEGQRQRARFASTGRPAEEGGSGKVYMVRAGLFNDVDVVVHWHASDVNFAGIDKALANKSAKFRFHGVSSHAAGSPETGPLGARWRRGNGHDGQHDARARPLGQRACTT